MLAATFSGMVILFAILIAGAVAIASPGASAVGGAVACVGLAAGFGAFGWYLSRAGFDRLLRELPF